MFHPRLLGAMAALAMFGAGCGGTESTEASAEFNSPAAGLSQRVG